jgi:hypothetical protein
MVEVAPNVAVKPETLLAPEATVGTTSDAKKSYGYARPITLPETMELTEEKTRVTETDDLPGHRSEEEIPKTDREGELQAGSRQREIALREGERTGVFLLIVEPSPI